MKVLFDTSVFVAAFEVNHPRHTACLPWFQQVQEEKIDGYLSTASKNLGLSRLKSTV